MISDILSNSKGSKHKSPNLVFRTSEHFGNIQFAIQPHVMLLYLLFRKYPKGGEKKQNKTAKPQKQLMTRFLATLRKHRGKFLVRNMAFRALICHYGFVFPISSNTSWTMSPTQHFNHHSQWDKFTQNIFTTISLRL